MNWECHNNFCINHLEKYQVIEVLQFSFSKYIIENIIHPFSFKIMKTITLSFKTTYLTLGLLFINFLFVNNSSAQTTTVTLTNTGASTWTVPAGVSGSILVEVWGGGGSGGGCTTGKDKGGSGGTGGTYASSVFTGIVSGTIYDLSIATSTSGTSGANGTNGGNSWFNTSGTLLANGGLGGFVGNGTARTAITTGSIGTTIIAGGNIIAGGSTGGSAGGAGGSASGGAGGSATTAAQNSQTTGNAGSAAGGGGSGGSTGAGNGGNAVAGGSGAQGQIKITYTNPACTTPIAQPTGLTFGTITGTSIAGSFTAASPASTNYLVVVNTTGISPTLTNGTSYTIGSTVLGGTNIIVDNDTNTSFSNTALSSATLYYFYIFAFNTTTCTGGPIYKSTSSLSGSATTSVTYCVPNPSSVDGMGITNVSYSSVNNATTDTGVYNNYTATQIGNVVQGASMPINVTISVGKTTYNIKVWVDWNNDGDFLDSGEEMLSGNDSKNLIGTFTIPAAAIVGNHRMRVGITQGQGNGVKNETATPCFTGVKGAFEDYILNVTAATCTTAIPTVTTSPSSVTIANNANTSFTGVFANTPSSYLWEVSSDGGINYTPITNGGVYTTATTATLTLTAANYGMNGFKYRVSASNACGTSTRSSVATLTITAPGYCSPTTPASTYWIASVASQGNLNDTSYTGSPGYSTSGFANYSATTLATQTPGGGMNFSIVLASSVDPGGSNKYDRSRFSCFVDWNGDGDFVDTGETVYTTGIYGVLETTFGFEVPQSQNPGNYRMRIRNRRDNLTAIDPCTAGSSYPTGEVEDYTIAVVQDCSSKILSVTNGSQCGNNTVTLSAVGLGGTTEYRWYSASTGGTIVATTSTGSWTTPSLTATTVYFVSAFNGSCESLVRTRVVATIVPVTTINFTPANPTTCGEDNIITINAAGDTTVLDLFVEDFEGASTGLTAAMTATNPGADSSWGVKTNTYTPSTIIWKPAINSGAVGSNFAMTTSDYAGAFITSRYSTTTSVNTTDFINLTLTFRNYFSYYTGGGVNSGKVQVSTNGGTNWTDVKTYTVDTGVASKFIEESIDLTAYINQTNLKLRFEYYGDWADGWAIDDIRLFGTKQLYTTFTWSAATPVAAFTDYACTNPYVAQKVNIIYLKPDLSQLETSMFPITVNATLGNGCPVSQIITVANNTKVWRGDIPGMSDTTSEWNDPNNWKPYGVPTASNCVVAPENTIISGTNYNAYAKNVVVKSTGTFELQAGNNLTVTDWIRVEDGGVFNVKNNASIVQINDNQNTGKVNIERITKPMNYYDYTYWNSPVTFASNFTVGSLSNQTTRDIWSYSPTVSGGSGNWVRLSSSSVMSPTKGYIIKAPDTFSNNTKVAYTANFVGTPNNGPILAPISKGSDLNLGGLVTVEDDEWNLIGNPYPSGLDAKKFLDFNPNVVDGTIYIWTHNTQPSAAAPDQFYGDYVLNYTSEDYASFNKTGGTGTASTATTGGNAPTGFIASGQSFFVKAAPAMANGTTANATFNNSMRVTNNSNPATGTNSDFFKTRNTTKGNTIEEKHRIWLNLTNNSGAFSQTLIGYLPDATQGLDRGFDGESFGGNDVTFYSIIPEANLTIQGRPLPFDASDIVTLGYNAAKKGNYSIRIDHLDGIFDNQDIYLEDKELNVVHNLKQKPYVFATKVGDFDSRFVLRYSDKTLGVDDNTINNTDLKISHIQNGNILLINNMFIDNAVEKVSLFNVLGQSISAWKIENQDQQNIQIPIKNLSSGIYVAKVKTSNGDYSKKIIIP